MGIFDDLKSVVKDAIGEENAKKLGDKIKEYANTASEQLKSTTSKEIPSDYTHFPAFNKPIERISTRVESKYKRCTMYFYNVTEEEINAYRDNIVSLGYEKMSDVRYEKDNEYIIVEEDGNQFHLAFHIKL